MQLGGRGPRETSFEVVTWNEVDVQLPVRQFVAGRSFTSKRCAAHSSRDRRSGSSTTSSSTSKTFVARREESNRCQPGVAVDRETHPRVRHPSRQGDDLLTWRISQQPSRMTARQIVEHEWHIKAVTCAEHAVLGGRRKRELVGVRRATARCVELREAGRTHPKEPVRVDALDEATRRRFGIRDAVRSRWPRGGREGPSAFRT